MSDTFSRHRNAVQAVLACVSQVPQGVTLSAIQSNISPEFKELSDDAIALAVSDGWIEHSPIFLDRWRWTRSEGPFEQAAAWVRLRNRARPLLARIHHHSGLPVTLHVLFSRAHTVIERFPADLPATIVEEVSRYAEPRPLTNGVTSKVFLAGLPSEIDEAAIVDQREREAIRQAGFCYAPTAKASWGGVLSAPVRATAGVPLAALCTFGASQMLTPERVDLIGPIMRAAADELAVESMADALLLREAAEALISTA